jgi:hypothetical protein
MQVVAFWRGATDLIPDDSGVVEVIHGYAEDVT